MKELVDIVEDLGCVEVKSYIQSGNVVLKSDKSASVLQQDVHNKIEEIKGFKINVLAISSMKFKAAVKNCPFETSEGKQLHYYFAITTPKNLNTELLEPLRTDTEKYELKGSVFYLYAPNGIGRSKLADKVEKAIGVPATARNNNTIQKLMELVG